jgi:transposase
MDKPKARVLKARRDQLEMREVDLESLIPGDHRARMVWSFVEGLDLGPLYAEFKAVESQPGRPGIDPPILMTLWLFATLEGVGSARALDRLCIEHNAYRWICGGVGVNYHSLSDFRVKHVEFLDDLLTRSVAALMMNGAVTLNRMAQDGVRVRANAGNSSFRRRKRLKEFLAVADEQVQRLRRELDEDPAASENRQQAAKQRAASERHERVTQALAEMEKIEAQYAAKHANGNKNPKNPRPDKTGSPPQDKREPRVSTTDPEARNMKGADGGFRPSYNVQFATDTASGVIVGLDVINRGTDWNELPTMLDQMKRRYNHCPEQSLVDGGFAKFDAIVEAENQGTQVFAPVPIKGKTELDPHQPRPKDPPAITQWRLRMATDEAKEIYRERAASAEWVNAQARNRGLRQFGVRGMVKAKAVVLWYALAHNLMRLPHLTAQAHPA